jgi:UDP-glucose 4-epimerase
VEACINAFEKCLFVNDVVNIGNDTEITVLNLAKLVIRLTESKSKIIHLPPLPDGDMTRRQPDISNMKFLLERDLTPLEEGLAEIIHYRKKATTSVL